MIRHELYPGIWLNILPDSRFKTNYFSLSFLTDMTSENAAPSHLLPMILGRGSEKYPDLGAINRALEMIWDGTLDSGTGRMGETRTIGFSACYPDDRFLPGNENIEDKTLAIFFDILLNPLTENGAFCQEYVESEKEKLCQRIATAINSKGKYAIRRLTAELCKDEPYGLPSAGTPEQVMEITPDALFAYYQKMLSEFPIEMFYIGNTEPAIIIKRIEKYLAALYQPKTTPPPSLVIRRAKAVRHIEETQSGKQGRLCMGLRTGTVISDKDFPAFVLMNEIFSGSPVSRLFTEVREKQSLCYYCSAVPDSLKGILTISAGIRDDNREKAEREIIRQIDAMKNGDFSDTEIEAARHSIESALRGMKDSRSTMESFTLRRLLAGVDTHVENYITSLRALTKEDIVAVANKFSLDTVFYLKPDFSKENDIEEGEDDA